MINISRILSTAFLFGIAFTSVSLAQNKEFKLPYKQNEWTADYKPFRIAGNLYYVGTQDLACYLLTTPDGHILFNTGLSESVPLIQAHVEMLGFKFEDIKLLMATHVHYDHVAGMAEIKRRTGAQMLVHSKDAKTLEDGGASDYIMGGTATFEGVKPDRLLRDQELVRFGGSAVKVLHHPGHTPGACSYLLTVKDEKRTYKVLIANIPSILEETKLSGMPGYPEVGKDYAKTLIAMKKQDFDLWVASHGSQFGLVEKRKNSALYDPMIFSDKAAYDKTLSDWQERYDLKTKQK